MPMRKIFLFLIAPFWMLWSVASVELRLGDSFTMNCSGSLDYWSLSRKSQPTIVVAYMLSTNSYDCASSFLVPNAPAQCRSDVTIDTVNAEYILLSSVRYEDAGIFKCHGHESYTFELAVVRNNGPTLQFSLQNRDTTPSSGGNDVYQGDWLVFNCTIQYAALNPPAMELVHRSHTGVDLVLQGTTSTIGIPFARNQNQYVTVTATYFVSIADRRFDVICRLPSFNTPAMMKTIQFNTVHDTLGAIIGAVIGVVILMLIVAIAAVYCIRRRKKHLEGKPNDRYLPTPAGYFSTQTTSLAALVEDGFKFLCFREENDAS